MHRTSRRISALALTAALGPAAVQAQDAALCEALAGAVQSPDAMRALTGQVADPQAQLLLCAEALTDADATALAQAMGDALDVDLVTALGDRAVLADESAAEAPTEGVADQEIETIDLRRNAQDGAVETVETDTLEAEAADLAEGEAPPAPETSIETLETEAAETDEPVAEEAAEIQPDAAPAEGGDVAEDTDAETSEVGEGTAIAEDTDAAASEPEAEASVAEETSAGGGEALTATAPSGSALTQQDAGEGDFATVDTDTAMTTVGTEGQGALSEGATALAEGALGTGDTAVALSTPEGADPAAPEGVEAPQADTAETAAAANTVADAAAAEAAADAATDAPMEDAQTVTVTAETARSATEEVQRAAPAAEADEGDLTAFQRALLLGLGAVAVGNVLQGQGQVVADTGDRVVVRRESGELRVLKDDDALLRRPGAQVSTRTFDDGSTLTRVNREDGSTVITIRSASGQVLRRTVIAPDGTETVLFDDLNTDIAPVEVADLPETQAREVEVEDLRAVLSARDAGIDRRYSLQQVRQIRAVRQLAPVVEVSDVTFETGSAVIRADQADALADIGNAMREAIAADPGEVFLVEGHTDAVGSAESNLALSDRRAESVALALAEFFGVPPENMVVQGYGESNLKILTGASERANRRAAVRRITPLLRGV